MSKDLQVYKENFFTKFRKKFQSLFKKDSKAENVATFENDKSKEHIMKLYKDVVAKKVDVNSLSTEEAYKITLLVNEEIKILSKKLDTSIENLTNQYSRVKFLTK